MTDELLISGILALYEKHDWSLRRVLLTPLLRSRLRSLAGLFGNAEIVESKIDAVWFSRPSGQDREAWELRLLRADPFALLETFPVDTSQNELRQRLNEIEDRMSESARRNFSGH
jgi:hypothetical protein